MKRVYKNNPLRDAVPYAVLGVIAGIILVLALIGSSWFVWWLHDKPADNYRICGERADALGAPTWYATGWRKDNCHAWKGKSETIIKL